MLLRVPIDVTKCRLFNENPVNHKICQIPIRRSEFEKILHDLGTALEGLSCAARELYQAGWPIFYTSVALAQRDPN